MWFSMLSQNWSYLHQNLVDLDNSFGSLVVGDGIYHICVEFEVKLVEIGEIVVFTTQYSLG